MPTGAPKTIAPRAFTRAPTDSKYKEYGKLTVRR